MITGIIFDMNGVIIDDERIQLLAWKKILKKLHLTLTEEEFKHKVIGRTEREVLETLFNHPLTEDQLENYSNQRIDIAIAAYKNHMELTPGLKKFLDTMRANNIHMGVATSNRKRYMNFIMDNLHIRDYFSVILTAQDINKGKPDPEIYIKTAKKMGTSPSNCLVFEDSISGIQAGKAACMKVIGLATTHAKAELTIADKVITDFNEADISLLLL